MRERYFWQQQIMSWCCTLLHNSHLINTEIIQSHAWNVAGSGFHEIIIQILERKWHNAERWKVLKAIYRISCGRLACVRVVWLTWVNGNCSELAPHLQTLCSTTRMANFWCATHDGVSHRSLSDVERCEWTRCSKSSKHSAASPRQPSGKRRLARGPLASALLSGSGHSAGSELVCSCVNKFCNEERMKKLIRKKWKISR